MSQKNLMDEELNRDIFKDTYKEILCINLFGLISVSW